MIRSTYAATVIFVLLLVAQTRAAVVTFEELSGPSGSTMPTGVSYLESGFAVTPVTGHWLQMIDSGPTSGVYGNPGPSLWEDTSTASLTVAAVSGDPFTFTSIDLWGETADYTMEGFLGGVSVFTVSANVPDDDWLTVSSPSTAMIDMLRIFVTKDQSEYSNVDNIRLNEPPVPEPTSLCVWSVLLAVASGVRCYWRH